MLKIIFVDDELDLLPLVKLCLSSELDEYPHTIDTVSSGAACLKLLETFPTSEQILVITDINMPQMNGFELIEQIKKIFPKVRYYVCTAYDTPEYERKAAAVGAMQFFSKPLDFKRLRSTIVSGFPAHAVTN